MRNEHTPDNREDAAHFACWHVAGPMQAAGLDVEREGNVITAWLGGVAYRVTVEPRPAQPVEEGPRVPLLKYA